MFNDACCFVTRDRIILNRQLQLRVMSALIELITRFSETTGGVHSLILEISKFSRGSDS